MQTPEDVPEPANLRFLRRLVTVLTAVMIFGLLTVIVLLVIRLSGPGPALVFPDDLPLEPGDSLTGYAQTGGHIVAVLADGRILIFDAQSLEQTREITLD